MKKIFSILLTLIAALGVFSCQTEKDADGSQYLAGPALESVSKEVVFAPQGGSGSIVINTRETLSASADRSWATVTVAGTLDGRTVTADFVVYVMGNIAAGSITVNGEPLAKFDPAKLSYSMTLEAGSAIPVVAATAVDDDLTVTVNQATELPGSATVVVTDRESASHSITLIDNAIDKVSTQRAKLGAYQNRLEHTINNLNTASENITAAESRIRDTDMAKEMMNFTKLQIMLQAGTSMLAQANQLPQNVLSLVR